MSTRKNPHKFVSRLDSQNLHILNDFSIANIWMSRNMIVFSLFKVTKYLNHRIRKYLHTGNRKKFHLSYFFLAFSNSYKYKYVSMSAQTFMVCERNFFFKPIFRNCFLFMKAESNTFIHIN